MSKGWLLTCFSASATRGRLYPSWLSAARESMLTCSPRRLLPYPLPSLRSRFSSFALDKGRTLTLYPNSIPIQHAS